MECARVLLLPGALATEKAAPRTLLYRDQQLETKLLDGVLYGLLGVWGILWRLKLRLPTDSRRAAFPDFSDSSLLVCAVSSGLTFMYLWEVTFNDYEKRKFVSLLQTDLDLQVTWIFIKNQ